MLEGAAGVWARHFPGITETIRVDAVIGSHPQNSTLGYLTFNASLFGVHNLTMFIREDDDRFWWVAVHEMGHGKLTGPGGVGPADSSPAFGYGHPSSYCGPATAAIWTGPCPLHNSHSVFPDQVMSKVMSEDPTLSPVSIAIIADTHGWYWRPCENCNRTCTNSICGYPPFDAPNPLHWPKTAFGPIVVSIYATVLLCVGLWNA